MPYASVAAGARSFTLGSRPQDAPTTDYDEELRVTRKDGEGGSPHAIRFGMYPGQRSGVHFNVDQDGSFNWYAMKDNPDNPAEPPAFSPTDEQWRAVLMYNHPTNQLRVGGSLETPTFYPGNLDIYTRADQCDEVAAGATTQKAVSCPNNAQVIGGGCNGGDSTFRLYRSVPRVDRNDFLCEFKNTGPHVRGCTVYALCLRKSPP